MAEPAGRPTSGSRLLRRLRSIEGAAVAGLIAAIGWVVALLGLLDIPDPWASDAEIIEYYDNLVDSPRVLIYLQVLVVSMVAFLWFVGVIRHRIGTREPKLFGTVFLGSGILLAGLLFVGVALAAAPSVLVAETDRAVDPDVAATFRTASRVLLAGFTSRVAAVFIFSTSTLALRTGAMARWFIVLSFLVGLGMFLNVTIAEPTVFAFPAWVAAVSLYLLFLAKDLDEPDET